MENKFLKILRKQDQNLAYELAKEQRWNIWVHPCSQGSFVLSDQVTASSQIQWARKKVWDRGWFECYKLQ